jgi:hypothetical protein
MRQATRINRAATAEEGAESRSGARRAIALGVLGAGALVGMATPAATAATMNIGTGTATAATATDAGSAAATTGTPTGTAVMGAQADVAQSPVNESDAAAGTAPATTTSTTTTTTNIAQTRAANWARLGKIKLYPLAGTAVDPLSNVVGTNLSGLPLSTATVNAVFSDGLPLRDLPVLGAVLAPPSATSSASDTDGSAALGSDSSTSSGTDSSASSGTDSSAASAAYGPAAAAGPASAADALADSGSAAPAE